MTEENIVDVSLERDVNDRSNEEKKYGVKGVEQRSQRGSQRPHAAVTVRQA